MQTETALFLGKVEWARTVSPLFLHSQRRPPILGHIMRLINAETLELELFPERVQDNYAILSHTWEEDKVLFEDMAAPRTA